METKLWSENKSDIKKTNMEARKAEKKEKLEQKEKSTQRETLRREK